MTTLVTGATGFVGSAVARALAARGHALRLLTRPTSDRRNLAGLDAEVVTGDLTDPASLARAAAGCRYVVHVAADYRILGARSRPPCCGPTSTAPSRCSAPPRRPAPNASCIAVPSRRSARSATAPRPTRPRPTNEADFVGIYKRSKYLAENAVLDLARREGLPVVVVNPAAPVGPRDIKPTPTGKMILDAAAGRVPAYIDTGLNIVHVDDVAEGHVLALEKGRVGERYVLGGENMLLKDILGLVADVVHRRPPLIRLPEAVVWPAAFVMEKLAGAHRHRADDDPRPPEDGPQEDVLLLGQGDGGARLPPPRRCAWRCEDAVAWFRANGMLRTMTVLAVADAADLDLPAASRHGRFWQAGPVLPAGTTRASTTPSVAVVVPARDEAPLDRGQPALAAGAGLPRPAARHPDRRQQHRRHRRHCPRDRRPAADGPHRRAAPRRMERQAMGRRTRRRRRRRSRPAAADRRRHRARARAPVARSSPRPSGTALTWCPKWSGWHCDSWAERALVPAFVFFFQLLYPFARVNDPLKRDRRGGRRNDPDPPPGPAAHRRHRERQRGFDRRCRPGGRGEERRPDLARTRRSWPARCGRIRPSATSGG